MTIVASNNAASIIDCISNNVQQLKKYVQNFDVYVENIGGATDDAEMRRSMAVIMEQSNSLSKKTSSLLKQLVLLSNTNTNYRVQRERLMDEYMKVLNQLQAAQRKAANKEKAQIQTVTIENERLSVHSSQPANNLQIQQQHRVNLDEIRECQQTLSQLEADINDVNQIYKDLARIVHNQGEMIDSIEANIDHASIYVEQGQTNVQQALYYQTKARQKKLLLLLFFSALIGILLLFLYLWTRY